MLCDQIKDFEDIKMEASWKNVLSQEFSKDYMSALKKFLFERKAQKKVLLPAGSDIFSAFNLTPFNKVKAVILN